MTKSWSNRVVKLLSLRLVAGSCTIAFKCSVCACLLYVMHLALVVCKPPFYSPQRLPSVYLGWVKVGVLHVALAVSFMQENAKKHDTKKVFWITSGAYNIPLFNSERCGLN